MFSPNYLYFFSYYKIITKIKKNEILFSNEESNRFYFPYQIQICNSLLSNFI